MTFTLHGGFQKTGMTCLQATLLIHQDWLLERGIRVVPPINQRKPGLERLQAHRSAVLSSVDMAADKRLVAVDEMLLGSLGQIIQTGDLNRSPEKPIAEYMEDFAVDPDTIILCVRDYAAFFSSVYVETLSSVTPQRFVMPEIAAARILGNMPNWIRLIESVVKRFKKSRILVYRYEDTGALYDKVLGALLGLEIAAEFANVAEDDLSQIVNKTPCQDILTRFLEKIYTNGVGHALREWPEMRSAEYLSNPFSLWSKDEAAHLSTLYEKDWVAIRNLENVQVLSA